MRRLCLLAAAATLAAMPALAQGFQPGDRVHIGLNGKDGTVLSVDGQNGNGGMQLKVHVDGAAYPPNVGVMYDAYTAQVTLIGHGAPPAPAMAMRPATAPGGGGMSASTAPPGNVAVSAASCQQAIRANYPTTGADQTRMFNFQAFNATGPAPYESIYKGDKMLGARGHGVMAMSIEAQFQVVTRYQDPNADDRIQSVHAHYKCYNMGGGIVAEKLDEMGSGISYAHKR